MSYKILLADDSVTVQKIITLTFSDEGVDVLTVNNGNDAITRLQSMRPALVMADVSIPGRNGYEICEFVKNHPELKNTPVILLVPAFETFDDERAQRSGADFHLTKPFQSIRTLITTVKNLIEHKTLPVSATVPQHKPAANEGDIDLVNGKSAKIEELIKQSTAPLSLPASLSSASALEIAPLEIAEEELLAPINVTHVASALAATAIGDEFVFAEDAPPFIASGVGAARMPAPIAEIGDDVLELDDVLPELRFPTELAPGPLQMAHPSTEAFAASPADEQQMSQRVIEEIAARVVAQMSAQFSDELSDKLLARLRGMSDELAHHLAPQVAEILQTERVSSYRITENLLEID